MLALQDICAPEGVCFGCGSANPDGLQIKSFWSGEFVVATFKPEKQFTGWEGWVYGGLISCLVDCHSNWTAIAFHYRAEGREPGTLPRITCVTGTLGVKYLKPTPMGATLSLKAWVEGDVARKSRVICEVWADDVMTAQGDSVFFRVELNV
jgi:hypothetical protein